MDALASPARRRDRFGAALACRHLAHFGPVAVLAVTALLLATTRLPPGTATVLRLLYGAVVALNVAALAMSAWSTLLGALVAPFAPAAGPRLMPPSGRARTAVLLPIYEEDAARVFAAALTMADSVAARAIGHFDVFVLSDSRSPDAIAAEEAMVTRSARATGPAIFYRHRVANTGRKAGNIADFVRRWGAAYDFMVVLDADSLMTGAAIARLVGAMEANPRAGLIQAMCFPIGRTTLFARLQQFDARLQGPLFQRGVAFWQGPRGNYWGHNAILRIAAFAGACGLPVLPGRPPLGGEILSHDTVEAALMLRAGHDVWMLPDGTPEEGSWEETPTNLLDHLERDRRWCRGNLQHVRVLAARGLRAASLYHLSRGLLHYLYAPLAVLWLVLYAVLDRRTAPDALILLVAGLIVAPRVACIVTACTDRALGFGGRWTLVRGALLDQFVIASSYPVTLLFHLAFLGGVLLRAEVRWDAQARDERGLTWAEATRRLGPPVAVGLVLVALLALVVPWASAALASGLLAAIPLAVLTSRPGSPGNALLRTPDDIRPHPIRAERDRIEALLRAGTDLDPAAEQRALPEEAGLAMEAQRLRPPGPPRPRLRTA